MSDNPYLQRILDDAQKLNLTWDELIKPPFRMQEILDVVNALVLTAEDLITDPGSGEQKQQLVMDAWDYLDAQYQIINKLDDLFKLPFYLEPFDGLMLRKVVEIVLIPAAVAAFNWTGIWKKEV